MSDELSEKLETYYRKGHDAKSQNAAMIYEDKFRELCWAAASEILSALKTVRGIEGITNTEGNSVTFVHKNADFNGLPNCCIVVTTDWSNEQTYRADTFAECVEAAGKKGEGRDG